MKWILEEAQDKKKLLWDVLDALNLPAFTLNSEFRITGINNSVGRMLCFYEKDVAGLPMFDILSVPNRDVLRRNVSVTEGSCLKKNRDTIPARATFVKHGDGYIAVIEDRSEIKKLSHRSSLRTREINAYNALSKSLSRTSDLKEMTKEVIGTLINVMGIDAAWLYLTEGDSNSLSLYCFEGIGEDAFCKAKELYTYECFIGRVLSSGRALLVRNAMEDPRITHINVKGAGFKSIAGIPLVIKSIGGSGRVVGVLGFASRVENRFSSFDMQFFSAVGNQLGVAVENVRLIEKLREKMRQIELINEISSVVNSSLSIGHIFRLVVSEVKRMTDFERASITLLDERKNNMRIFALDTDMQTKLKKGVRAPLEGTSASWVTKNYKPWINADLEKEMPFAKDNVLLNEGIRSTISVPLYKDKPLGALNFDSIHPNRYSEKDLEILLPVAKHLSIALENALLFEEISREKREWEKTFDSITDMVWIEDIGGRILRANSEVVERTGMRESFLVQKTSAEIFKALKIYDTEVLSYQFPARRKRPYRELAAPDGSIFHFWAYPLIDNEGNIYGAVNYLKDITEQKRLEQQLLRASKLASLGTLVAGIAHEINNPLGIIAGYSEALLDRAKDAGLLSVESFEDFPEYLETINNEIFRCKDILKSLLDFARPSAGTFREIDINELIKEVILLVQHRARKQNHTIELKLQRNIPKTAADPGALRQLLMNIIMNSFYFMETEGKITIRTICETDSANTRLIHISISDNGRGIEKDVMERIFDPFFTTKPAGDGTGLGLSICHRIVSGHDGTIDVQSEPGKETTFNIRIPVKGIFPAD